MKFDRQISSFIPQKHPNCDSAPLLSAPCSLVGSESLSVLKEDPNISNEEIILVENPIIEHIHVESEEDSKNLRVETLSPGNKVTHTSSEGPGDDNDDSNESFCSHNLCNGDINHLLPMLLPCPYISSNRHEDAAVFSQLISTESNVNDNDNKSTSTPSFFFSRIQSIISGMGSPHGDSRNRDVSEDDEESSELFTSEDEDKTKCTPEQGIGPRRYLSSLGYVPNRFDEVIPNRGYTIPSHYKECYHRQVYSPITPSNHEESKCQLKTQHKYNGWSPRPEGQNDDEYTSPILDDCMRKKPKSSQSISQGTPKEKLLSPPNPRKKRRRTTHPLDDYEQRHHRHYSIFSPDGVEAANPAIIHYLHLGKWCTSAAEYFLHRFPSINETRGHAVVWLHTAKPRDRFVYLVSPVEAAPHETLLGRFWRMLYGNPPNFALNDGQIMWSDGDREKVKKKKKNISLVSPNVVEESPSVPQGITAIEVLHSDITALDYSAGLMGTRFSIETKRVACRWFSTKDAALKYYDSLDKLPYYHQIKPGGVGAVHMAERVSVANKLAEKGKLFTKGFTDAPVGYPFSEVGSNDRLYRVNSIAANVVTSPWASSTFGSRLESDNQNDDKNQCEYKSDEGFKHLLSGPIVPFCNSPTEVSKSIKEFIHGVSLVDNGKRDQPSILVKSQSINENRAKFVDQNGCKYKDNERVCETQDTIKNKHRSDERSNIFNDDDSFTSKLDIPKDAAVHNDEVVTTGYCSPFTIQNQSFNVKNVNNLEEDQLRKNCDSSSNGGNSAIIYSGTDRSSVTFPSHIVVPPLSNLNADSNIVSSHPIDDGHLQRKSNDHKVEMSRGPNKTQPQEHVETAEPVHNITNTLEQLSPSPCPVFPAPSSTDGTFDEDQTTFTKTFSRSKKARLDTTPVDGYISSTHYNTMVVLYTQDPYFNHILKEVLAPEAGKTPFTVSEKEQTRMLGLAEAGIPSWAIFCARWGLPYRRWLRLIIVSVLNIWPLIALCVGAYDLYRHLPQLRNFLADWLTPLNNWLSENFTITSSFYFTYMLTVMLGVLQSLHALGKTIAHFVAFIIAPLRPLIAFVKLLSGPITWLIQILLLLFQPIILLVKGVYNFLMAPYYFIVFITSYGSSNIVTASSNAVQGAGVASKLWATYMEFWIQIARPIKNITKAFYDGIVHVGVAISKRDATLRRIYRANAPAFIQVTSDLFWNFAASIFRLLRYFHRLVVYTLEYNTVKVLVIVVCVSVLYWAMLRDNSDGIYSEL